MRFTTPAMTGAIRAAAYNNTYRMAQVKEGGHDENVIRILKRGVIIPSETIPWWPSPIL